MKLPRRLATALGVGAVSAALVLSTAPPAQAFVPPPVLPPALGVLSLGTNAGGLAAAAGGVCATGAGCVVLAAGALLAVGAWAAYENRELIAEWIGADSGQETQFDGVNLSPGMSALNFAGLNKSTYSWTLEAVQTTGKLQYVGHCLRPSGAVTTTSSIDGTNRGVGFVASNLASWAQTCERPIAEGGWGGKLKWFALYIYRDGSFYRLIGAYGSPYVEYQSYTNVTCRLADGSTVALPQAIGTSTGTGGAAPVPSCAQAYPGARTESFTITRQQPDGTTRPVMSWAANNTALASYPDCAPSDANCALQVTYNGSPCTPGADFCYDWYQRSQNSPANYQCKWGPYSVPLSWCQPLRYAYSWSPVRDTNGWPTAPGTLTDPTVPTPSPTPTPTATATPSPSPSPTTSAPPGTGTYTGPTAPPAGTPLPGPNPSDAPSGSNCSLGWDSVLDGTVIYKAVSCALAWAFVPSPAVMESAKTELDTAWASSDVGTFVTQARTTFAGVGSDLEAAGAGGSCAGWTVPVPLYGTESDLKILDSCEEPMTTIASTTKTIGTVIVGVGGLLLLVNTGLGAFGLPRLWNRGEEV